MSRFAGWLVILLFKGVTVAVPAEEAKIAVASNFAMPMRAILEEFHQETDHQILLSLGSTGKLYAQILQGAPFDAFFAADQERPRRLEMAGRIVPQSRFTYARGQLVLWSPRSNLIDANGSVLRRQHFRRLAIANPRLAPYGRAAEEVLRDFGVWDSLQPRLVRGENVGQAYHFVASGNAELGLLAASQVLDPAKEAGGSLWIPPAELYEPIAQDAVLLRSNGAADALLRFVRTEAVQALLAEYGYVVNHE